MGTRQIDTEVPTNGKKRRIANSAHLGSSPGAHETSNHSSIVCYSWPAVWPSRRHSTVALIITTDIHWYVTAGGSQPLHCFFGSLKIETDACPPDLKIHVNCQRHHPPLEIKRHQSWKQFMGNNVKKPVSLITKNGRDVSGSRGSVAICRLRSKFPRMAFGTQLMPPGKPVIAPPVKLLGLATTVGLRVGGTIGLTVVSPILAVSEVSGDWAGLPWPTAGYTDWNVCSATEGPRSGKLLNRVINFWGTVTESRNVTGGFSPDGNVWFGRSSWFRGLCETQMWEGSDGGTAECRKLGDGGLGDGDSSDDAPVPASPLRGKRC